MSDPIVPASHSAPPASGSDHPTAGVPSDNTTLVAILRDLRGQGYSASLSADDGGQVMCSECGDRSDASEFVAAVERRLEGASDPADELLVLGGPCPRCGTHGVIVLGFGPEASKVDSDVMSRLSVEPA